MRQMNLCIVFIDGDDINEILEDQTNIVEILNREAKKAKQIKLFAKAE